ncbi:PAS domain-containing hybrid sensor histidine kinase/response regulator [Rubellimicrobium mesophilum]|nr:PAS domain-containing protein [Rubellimicrobium mesophilum]
MEALSPILDGPARSPVARMVADLDWASTPLGAPEGWPVPLRTLLGVMMGSNQPMFVAWGPKGTLLYNDPYVEVLAGKHPAALGCPLLDVWHEIRDDLAPIVERVLGGEPVQMDDIRFTLERRGYAEEAHFAFSYTPVRDEGGSVAGFFCACRETTGQVLAERGLRDSERRLRSVLDGMDEAFGLLDRDFRILTFNQAAMALESRPLEEILGRCHWEVYPGSEGSELGRLYRRAMDERVPVELEHRYVWPDGTPRWLDMRAYPVPEGLAVFWRDITARKEAEARLRASEARAREEAERVQLALDSGAILGTWEWDIPADRFTAGEIFARSFGLDPEACRTGLPIGRVVETVHPEDLPDLVATIGRAVAEGGLSVRQYRVGRADGLYYWVEAAGRVDLGPDGKPLRFQGVLIDAEPRRAAEAERDRAMRLLKAFVEAVPGVVYAKDREGRMLVGNRGTSELIGKPPEEYLGLTDAEFLEDEAQARAVMETDRRIMDSGQAEQVEEEVRLADGTPAVWLSTKAPMRDAEGRVVGLIGSSVDITARKAAEAALRESEERFRFALDAAGGIGTWDWDVARDLVHTSEHFARTYGIDPGRARAGLPVEDYVGGIHPDDRAEVARLIGEALATGGEYRAEYRILDGDGEVHWVVARGRCLTDDAGRPVRFPGVTFDITDRKAVEARALESESRLRAVLEAVPVGLVFADARGWITGGNARVEGILGHSILHSRGVEDYGRWISFHPDGRQVEGREYPLARALAGEERPELEVSYQRGDGRRAWVRFIASAVRDADGAVTGGVVASLDMDRERRAEEELRHLNETLERRVAEAIAERERAEEALRQAQKMEAVGQLTGGIAHDFNNMLAAVMGSLDLLGRRIGEEDARARRYVGAAMEGARRAATLTQRLLAFSRQQPLRPEPIDANRLVQGMSDLLRRSLGAGVKLETVLAGGLWRTSADPNQLENVILNLALNARDAMPEGGRLTIETVNAHLDSRYSARHLGVPAGQYVQIAVTDTGHGMTPEVMARAFDPFYTTKPVGQGTGLGLSQVYGFVRQSGGHVKLYSEPGQGTTVKIYLPRLPGPHPEEPPGERREDLPLGEAQEVVLVVEDEAVVRQFTVDALGELGYRVLAAESAGAALRLLDAHPEVQLLFTDVVMPDMDGRRLADEALRRRPDLRVLFTTGYSRNAVVHNGVLDPGVHLIGKPFTVEALAAKLREVLDGMPAQA